MHRPLAATRWRRAAIALLLVGGALSAGVYLSARRAVEVAEFGSGSIAEKRELNQLERLNGKGGVMMFRFQQWFESLWHGERLGLTLGALSLLLAALCWHLALLAEEDQ
jgi:hypothetical protein